MNSGVSGLKLVMTKLGIVENANPVVKWSATATKPLESATALWA